MPFRDIFNHVLGESKKKLDEDKRGKRMDKLPLKQQYLNATFDNGDKMYNSPEDLLELTVMTPEGKYGYIKDYSKEVDADGFPLQVIITTNEEDDIRAGKRVDASTLIAPHEIRVASADLNNEADKKRIQGLVAAGKTDEEIINDVFDPAQYESTPENQQQVKDFVATVRSTMPAKVDPVVDLLNQIKARATELGKASNIDVTAYIDGLEHNFEPIAYQDISDEDLITDIKDFNENANNPDEEFVPQEPKEEEEIDWDKELGENKVNEIKCKKCGKNVPISKDTKAKKVTCFNCQESISEDKKSLANMNIGDYVSWKSHEGIKKAGSGRIIDVWQNKEDGWVATAKNSFETVALLDSDLAESKVEEGKTHNDYKAMKARLKTEKDPVKRKQLQDEIADIEDHWKQTWEGIDTFGTIKDLSYLVWCKKQNLDAYNSDNIRKYKQSEDYKKRVEREEMVDEAIKPEAITKIQGWIKEKGLRPAAIKVVDWCLYRKCGMTSGDMPDTSEFANGVDEVEDQLKNQDFQGALDAAKETANDMIQAAKDEIGESKHKPELKVARYGKEFWIIQDGHKMTGPYADTDTAEKELSKIKESKDPEMDFHYVKGYISDMIKNWDVVTSRANALDNLKQKLSTILNAMNESQGASFGKTAKLNWNQVEKYLNDNYLKFDEIVTTNDGLKLFYSTIKGENRHVATFNTKTGELFYGVNVKESVNENRYLKLIHNLLYKVEQLIKKMKAKGQLDGDSTVLDALQDWAEEVYAMGMSESKVNEEEALMGNNATTAAPAPQDVSQVPEEPVADKPATPTPEPLEKAGPVKEYLGNNGSDTYFYLVVVSGDEGTPKELQITDANEEVIYTTKDSNLNVEDIAGFIKSAIKEKEIANISTDLMDKYLFPAEAPVVDVAQEEEKPETEMPQAEDVPHQPAMESLLKKFDLVDIKEGLGDAIQNYNRKLGELENALAVFVKDPKIREWLKKNDPQALEQAEEALDKPLKENLVDIKWNIFCLMEKFGLIETNMEKLLEKYKLAEVFSINDDETVKEEVPVVEEPVQPGVEKPVIDANGKEQVPDNMTGPATDSDVDAPVDIPTTPEEARTKIQLEYPEEPFTSLAMAYADSMIDDPAVYKPIRQLQYEGIWVNADTFKKLAKVVGELNSFDGSATAEMLIGKFKGDSSKYRISRDNSVVIDIVVRDMQAKHSLEAIKDLVNASSVEDKGDGNVQIKF